MVSLAPLKTNTHLKVLAGQDFLFHGRNFCEDFLKNESGISLQWLHEEGSCVLKGQNLMTVFLLEESPKIYFLLKGLAYLCGARTLIHSYVYKAGRSRVIAQPSKQASFENWEKEVILASGGVLDLDFQTCSSKQDIENSPEDSALAVSFQDKNFKELLACMPETREKGVCGSLLPKDCDDLSLLDVDFISPQELRGYFPQVNISLHASE